MPIMSYNYGARNRKRVEEACAAAACTQWPL